MNEVVKDLRKFGELNRKYCNGDIDAVECQIAEDALIQKYEKPFAPEQLIELGWEKASEFSYKIYNGKYKYKDNVEWFLNLVPDRLENYCIGGLIIGYYDTLNDNQYYALYNAEIPSTHAELLTLLKLVIGEGK